MNVRKFLSTLMAVMFVLAVVAYAVGADNVGALLIVFQVTCFIALLVVDAIEDL